MRDNYCARRFANPFRPILSVDTLPETPSYFEPDAEALCDYCQTLTQVLCQQSRLPEMEKSLRGLLCELMWMFAGELNAPR